eukprot:558331_1
MNPHHQNPVNPQPNNSVNPQQHNPENPQHHNSYSMPPKHSNTMSRPGPYSIDSIFEMNPRIEMLDRIYNPVLNQPTDPPTNQKQPNMNNQDDMDPQRRKLLQQMHMIRQQQKPSKNKYENFIDRKGRLLRKLSNPKPRRKMNIIIPEPQNMTDKKLQINKPHGRLNLQSQMESPDISNPPQKFLMNLLKKHKNMMRTRRLQIIGPNRHRVTQESNQPDLKPLTVQQFQRLLRKSIRLTDRQHLLHMTKMRASTRI